MSHFAQVIDGIVTQVIVIEQDVVDTGHFGDPATWIQTSYNTYGGQHRLGGTPLRKNYAGIGYTYDAAKDQFVASRPYASWSLDSNNDWQAPTEKPNDGKMYAWNEASLTWVVVVG
jgi:hypothetical protein